MPRLFTGLEIPRDVAVELSGMRGGLAGARWIEPENYHVTLRFIGDVDNRTANAVADMLSDIVRPAFEISFDGLGAFGGRKPHSLHAAIQPTFPLVALQAEHERAMQRIGLAPEGRKFTPHVTLARLRGTPSEAVARYIGSRGGLLGTRFGAERFVLFSARSGQGGGPYLVEEAYTLDGYSEPEFSEETAWRRS